MNHTIVRLLLLLFLTALLAEPASAQRPTPTSPSGGDQHIVLNYDRAAIPGDQILWAPKTLLGYDDDEGLRYGSIYLVCESESDSRTGKCPVADTHETGDGRSYVPVQFVERRSGVRVDLMVEGWLLRASSSRACGGDYWQVREYRLSSSHFVACSTWLPTGTGGALQLPASELERLVAGRWDAVLKLHLRTDESDTNLATYTFTFDLTITDHDRVSIYFPEYDQATPHVGLNVRYNPVSTPSLSGRRDLEMCLYDGLGSQSPYLEISVADTGRPAPGRPPDRFSVWNEAAAGSDERDRLDYTVTLRHAGVPIPMHNGVLQALNGIDSAELRLVVLPGMSLPVYCVPTPLTLVAPRVDAASKTEGYYQGNLTIVLNVPTGTP